jgi:hypothetical protein
MKAVHRIVVISADTNDTKRGQPGVNLGSTWGGPVVNLWSIWGQPGVNLGSGWVNLHRPTVTRVHGTVPLSPMSCKNTWVPRKLEECTRTV